MDYMKTISDLCAVIDSMTGIVRVQAKELDCPKTISDLCAVIDHMTGTVQAQAEELAQLGALDHAEEIAAVRAKYTQAIGEEVGA